MERRFADDRVSPVFFAGELIDLGWGT